MTYFSRYMKIHSFFLVIPRIVPGPCVHGWMDGCMHAWMDGWLAGWLAGWIDGWTNSQRDSCMDKTSICMALIVRQLTVKHLIGLKNMIAINKSH